MFIDDNCALTLDLPGSDNVVMMERAFLLAVQVIACGSTQMNQFPERPSSI
jgi:hypothetical protein